MAQHELVYIENSEFQTFQHRSSQKLSYELIEMDKVQVIKLTYHTHPNLAQLLFASDLIMLQSSEISF